jgi:hypothetical protein
MVLMCLVDQLEDGKMLLIEDLPDKPTDLLVL